MFTVKPECLVSLLICERMLDNEAIYLQNCLQYSNYKGYGGQFKYNGPFEININDSKHCSIAAIDAIPFFDTKEQYQNIKIIDREIIKSLSGFQGVSDADKYDIITGNWGCGAFMGDPQIKFMLQWISCSYLDRKMIYCTFNDKRLQDNRLQEVYSKFKGQTLQNLYNAITNYCKWENFRNQDMLSYLIQYE